MRERSAFYRAKLDGLGDVGLDEIAALPLTDKAELRATVSAEHPFGTHFCARPEEIVRIHSTSGTTGTPSYIPLTAQDLDNWVTGSSRSYAAAGLQPGMRVVTTYNAGPFAAGAALAAFDRLGVCHIPFGTGNTERVVQSHRAAARRRRRAHAVLRRLHRRVVRRARVRPRRLERRARARRRRAGRRRARLPRRARTGLGRARDRGDGHRRHRRLAVGRVRAPGRDAPRGVRLRAPRADRPGHRAGGRARGRRDRRAGAHAPAPPRRAVAALPHARPRAGADDPVPVRAPRPARALHRAHRRHADRPRRQRLSLRRARGRRRLHAERQRATSSSARRPPASSRNRRCRSRSSSRTASSTTRRSPTRSAPACAMCSIVQTSVDLLPFGTLPRSEYKSRLVQHEEA